MANVPLSEYIRRRRMSLAVADLQSDEAKIIDVALKYGYDSPISFNRAFQSIHGIAPSFVKQSGMSVKSYPPISFKIIIKGVEEMNCRIEKKETFRIVGTSKMLDKSILLTIDSRIAVVNGNNVELDVPAQVVNGSTIIPLRFVAENLGVYVDFINLITFISTTPPHFSTTTFTSYQQILDYQAARINEVMPTLVEKIEQIAQDDIDDAWEWYLVWYSAMLVSDDISIRGSRAMNDLFYSINGDMEEFYRANGNMGEWTTYVDLMNESYMEAWNHLTDVFHELSVRLGFS